MKYRVIIAGEGDCDPEFVISEAQKLAKALPGVAHAEVETPGTIGGQILTDFDADPRALVDALQDPIPPEVDEVTDAPEPQVLEPESAGEDEDA